MTEDPNYVPPARYTLWVATKWTMFFVVAVLAGGDQLVAFLHQVVPFMK